MDVYVKIIKIFEKTMLKSNLCYFEFAFFMIQTHLEIRNIRLSVYLLVVKCFNFISYCDLDNARTDCKGK